MRIDLRNRSSKRRGSMDDVGGMGKVRGDGVAWGLSNKSDER